MRNLKKILSLALALVMVFSLMTFASAQDFNDAADIEHTEAVEVLTALEVIDGVGNNTFNPNGKVTRAQMAKMITLISLGNVSVEAFKGTTTDLTDINGHWAEAYIKYCYSQGIISGKGSGKFDPDAYVTTAEAAKMLLVAIGYNSDVQVYEGPQWNINVIRDAQTNDIFEELSLANDLQINRDQAAQMMYNALNTGVIIKTSDVSRVDGSIIDSYSKSKDPNKETLLGNSFKGQIWVGTFTGNEKSGATSLKDGICVYGKIEGSNNGNRNANLVYDFDIANIGEEVKVIFKDGTSGTKNVPDKDDTIYGVYRTGSTSVVNATRNDVKDGSDSPKDPTKVKIGSTEYKIASNSGTTIQFNYNDSYNEDGLTSVTGAGKAGIEALKKSQNGDTLKLVLNDNDEIISVYVVHTTISYVTSVTSDKITLNNIGTIEIAKNDIYDGAAKNDIVTVTKYYESDKDDAYFVVEKAESVTGTLTAYKYTVRSSDSANVCESITLDGTAYKVYEKPQNLPSRNIDSQQTVTSFNTNNIDQSFTAYLVNGYVGYVLQSGDSANNYALVVDVDTSGILGSTFKTPKIELLLADGTKVTATVHKDSTLYTTTGSPANFANDGAKLPSDANAAINTGLVVGQLVRYSVNSNGEYKVIESKSGSGNAIDGYYQTYELSQSKKVYDDDLKTFNGLVTAGGCVLFVHNTDPQKTGEYKAYDIRTLKDLTVSSATVGMLVKDGKVVAAYTEYNGRPSGAASDRVYGVVSAYNGTVKDSKGDTYLGWTVENCDANGETHSYEVLLDTNSTKIAKDRGQLVSFEPVVDGVYNDADITIYDGSDYTNSAKGLAAWVDEYIAGDSTIRVWKAVRKTGDLYVGATRESVKALDDDCVIVYVDQDGRKAGSLIDINEYNETTGYRNVLLVKDSGTDKVVAIFVESSNEKDILRKNPDTLVNNPAPEVVLPEGHKSVTGTGGAANYTVAAQAKSGDNDKVVVTVTYDSDTVSAEEQNVIVPVDTAARVVNNLTFTFPAGSKKGDAQFQEILGVSGKTVTIGKATAVKGAAKPVTSYNLSADTVELTAAGNDGAKTVTVSNILPDDATSKAVTVESANTAKVTATVSGTTITIKAADGLTATANGTVNVTVQVGGAVSQTITVTINIPKTEQTISNEVKTGLSTADQEITVADDKFFSPDNANIDWASVANTLTVKGEVKGTDTAKVARPVATTAPDTQHKVTINAPDPAVVMSKGSVSNFSSESFESMLEGKTSKSLAIYRIDLATAGGVADKSQVKVGAAGAWKQLVNDTYLDLIVGNATESVAITLDVDGDTSTTTEGDIVTITFNVTDWAPNA